METTFDTAAASSLDPLAGEALRMSQADVHLLVHREGNWFRAPDRPVVHCRTRRSIRLLLAKLAMHRELYPGVPLGRDQLREIGWPNERMSALSARNRLKQAMRILRRLGMGNLLVWQNGGYFIRPDAPFELAH